MKRFLIHSVLFIVLLLTSFFVVFSMADGTTDAFYSKFSSPQQESLIVGSSRAAQGLHPSVIDSVYGSRNLYNYAFTIPGTPYGKTYYNSILGKLNTNSKNGVFIIEVNPWTLSEYNYKKENGVEYPEDELFSAKTDYVNMNPNIEYLVESYNSKYEAIIRNKGRKGTYRTFYVHDNGWLEVTIESDMISKSERTAEKILDYQKRISSYTGLSEYRLNYLIKTIDLFKQQGDVYLVRIPVIEAMLDIENKIVSGFDEKMDEISKEQHIPYINMMPFNDNYNYTDGNHLSVSSGKQFSIDLAAKMKALKEQ